MKLFSQKMDPYIPVFLDVAANHFQIILHGFGDIAAVLQPISLERVELPAFVVQKIFPFR